MNKNANLKCVTSTEVEASTFGMSFDAEATTWVRSNGGKKVFPTKSGKYGTNPKTLDTIMYKDDGKSVVGSIGNFNPATAKKGDKGANAKSEESGIGFSWTVDSVVT